MATARKFTAPGRPNVWGVQTKDGRWFTYAYLDPAYAGYLSSKLDSMGQVGESNLYDRPLLVSPRKSDAEPKNISHTPFWRDYTLETSEQ